MKHEEVASCWSSLTVTSYDWGPRTKQKWACVRLRCRSKHRRLCEIAHQVAQPIGKKSLLQFSWRVLMISIWQWQVVFPSHCMNPTGKNLEDEKPEALIFIFISWIFFSWPAEKTSWTFHTSGVMSVVRSLKVLFPLSDCTIWSLHLASTHNAYLHPFSRKLLHAERPERLVLIIIGIGGNFRVCIPLEDRFWSRPKPNIDHSLLSPFIVRSHFNFHEFNGEIILRRICCVLLCNR